MRKIILLVVTLITATLATAQIIKVQEQKSTFSVGEQNALSIIVYNNSKKEVISKWKEYLKNYKNEKVKYDDEELVGDDLQIKELSVTPVDVYTRFVENKSDNTVQMFVAFSLGSTYISSQNDAATYSAAEKLLKDFVVKTTKFPIEEKLNDAQKLLKTMESDQKDLEKENKDLNNSIENYKEKISKARDDIKKNGEAQNKSKEQMEKQKAAIKLLNTQIEGVK